MSSGLLLRMAQTLYPNVYHAFLPQVGCDAAHKVTYATRFSVSSRSSEYFGGINIRGFPSSPLVAVGKGLKPTRDR
jgi:hypothetical protein